MLDAIAPSALLPGVLVMTDANCRARVIVDRGSCLDRLAECYRCSHVVKISTDGASYLAPTENPPDAQTAVPTTPVVVSDTIGAGADPARHRELSTRWSR